MSVFDCGRMIGKLLLASTLAFVAASAPAEEPSIPLRVDDIIGMAAWTGLRSLSLSPDGKWAAYAVRSRDRAPSVNADQFPRSGVPSWAVNSDIFVVDLRTFITRKLTGGKGNSWLPAWSPDSRYLAFASDRDSGEAKLWVWDTTRKEPERVSDERLRTHQIEWMADSQGLVVTALPSGLSVEEYVERFGGATLGAHEKPSDELSVRVYRGGPKSPEEEAVSSAGPWNLEEYTADLVRIDRVSGAGKVLVGGTRIAKFLASPTGREVAYSSPVRFERSESQQILYDLFVVDSETGVKRSAASLVRFVFGDQFNWSPDGEHLAYRAFGPEERVRNCFVVDLRNGKIQNASRLPANLASPTHVSAIPAWDPSGTKLYFIADSEVWCSDLADNRVRRIGRPSGRAVAELVRQSARLFRPAGRNVAIVVTHDDENKQDGFYEIDLATGTSKPLRENGECYRCSPSTGNGFVTMADHAPTVAYFAQGAASPSDLWISPPDFSHPRRASNLNPQLSKYVMGHPRVIDWLGDNGRRLRGGLLLPASYEPGKRYPLIVMVYGGDLVSDYTPLFGGGPWRGMPHLNAQLLATRGYAVLSPDAPQQMGSPMVDIAKTVLPGVNRAIELGIADPERLGVLGHSYGGYSVLSLLVQTKRFKGAFESSGYADLVGNYGAMDDTGAAFGVTIEETGQGLMGGPLWSYRERYIENSPIFYLDRVETPLLMVHGAKDTAVASFLGDEIFVGLRRLGKRVEYRKYFGEGHVPNGTANRRDIAEHMIEWFDQYVKGPKQETPQREDAMKQGNKQ